MTDLAPPVPIMDALDLLFRRLVLAARAANALSRPLDLGEVTTTLVPYRMARRDGALESNDDYLHLMMRLIAGERGLVFADELMQDDLRAELASPNPDLSLIRTYMNSRITLASDQVQRVLAGDTTIDDRPSTPTGVVTEATVPSAAAAAPQAPSTAPSTAPPAPTVPVFYPPRPEPIPAPAPPRGGALFEAVSPTEPEPVATSRADCGYCGQHLPEGRPVKFCPNCGQNLLIRRCAGCSSEMESGWKFCVTCGRAA